MVNLKVKQFTAASASKEPACLSKRVSDYVLEYIGARQLNPGDKIPSEVQLSSDLKVSRGIVREAYRSLSAAGIIEVAAGCRPKVGELSDSFLRDMIRQGICTRQFSPEQVLNLSSMMEVRAAELAAQKRTMRDLQQLRSVVARMRRAIGQTNHFFSRELAFH